MWFQLAMRSSTNLRSTNQAEVVHHSLARIQSQAKVDLPPSSIQYAARLACRNAGPTAPPMMRSAWVPQKSGTP
jgi:hypothetical protein